MLTEYNVIHQCNFFRPFWYRSRAINLQSQYFNKLFLSCLEHTAYTLVFPEEENY